MGLQEAAAPKGCSRAHHFLSGRGLRVPALRLYERPLRAGLRRKNEIGRVAGRLPRSVGGSAGRCVTPTSFDLQRSYSAYVWVLFLSAGWVTRGRRFEPGWLCSDKMLLRGWLHGPLVASGDEGFTCLCECTGSTRPDLWTIEPGKGTRPTVRPSVVPRHIGGSLPAFPRSDPLFPLV
jgi:hypothetical protein